MILAALAFAAAVSAEPAAPLTCAAAHAEIRALNEGRGGSPVPLTLKCEDGKAVQISKFVRPPPIAERTPNLYHEPELPG